MVLVQNVSKLYRLYAKPSDRLWEFTPFYRNRRPVEFWALKGVTLSVDSGEILGIVGPNGSGKSTLLQIASGIVRPTIGRVSVEGRVAALLELGAGFNPEFLNSASTYARAFSNPGVPTLRPSNASEARISMWRHHRLPSEAGSWVATTKRVTRTESSFIALS